MTAYRAGLSRRRSFRISCIGSSAGPARFPAGPRRAANVFGSLSFGTRRCNISGSTGPQGRMSRRQDRSSVFPYSFPRSRCQHAVLFRSTRKSSLIKAAFFLCQRTGPVPGGLSFLSCCHRCLSESYTTPPGGQVCSAAAGAVSMDRSIIPAEAHGSHLHSLVFFSFYPKPPLAQYLYLFLDIYTHTSTPSDTTLGTRKKPPRREALFISF